MPKANGNRSDAWLAYKLRWKRRRLLLRAFRARRDLNPVADRTKHILGDNILAAMTVRNEISRLPYFLKHHRKIGVDHFLIVDNDSTDGTRDYLAAQPDISLWHTTQSYRQSRFGMDWLTWLQRRHAHGHWCLTLDADELFIFPHHERHSLQDLTAWLDKKSVPGIMALMLDMYPKGPPGAQPHVPGQDPIEVLPWFDADNYSAEIQPKLQNLWVRGGVRARKFFAQDPARAPTLNKTPLIKWNRSYTYFNSTHTILPRRLNELYQNPQLPTGILLHTKFMPTVVDKAIEEKNRKEHFNDPALYQTYYDGLIADPDLWHESSHRYIGWKQLESLGLMSQGDWN
jgi:glycosyltransferase involved in cell wall biosynthesis